MESRESYIIANYKLLFLIHLFANLLIALFFTLFLQKHLLTVERAVAKIDRATENAEVISVVYVANVKQKEP